MIKYLFVGLVGLFVPCITALIMIYSSQNQELIKDFCSRLFLFKVTPSSLVIIFLLMPIVILLATTISLLFGQSAAQFS
jgi:hypothetical protein